MWLLDLINKLRDKYDDIIDDLMEYLDDNNFIRRKQFYIGYNFTNFNI